tara:strand:+ start:6206 stop:9589 length:3384 start_codon:yes stop_codon:yes gene_type:complete
MKELVLLPEEIRELLSFLNRGHNLGKVKKIFFEMKYEEFCKELIEEGYLSFEEIDSNRVLPYKLTAKGKVVNHIFRDDKKFESIVNEFPNGVSSYALGFIYSSHEAREKVRSEEEFEDRRYSPYELGAALELGRADLNELILAKGYDFDTTGNFKVSRRIFDELVKLPKGEIEDIIRPKLNLTTIKQAKRRLIEFARKLIPEELRDIVRIPTTSSGYYFSLQNAETPKVQELLKELKQKTVNTSIGANSDLPGVENIMIFQKRFDDGDLLKNHIGKADINFYLKSQEEILAKNIRIALTHEKSRIAIFLRKYQEEYGGDNDGKANDTFQNLNIQSTIKNQLQLATLNSDSVKGGEDLLGFDQDINAFAAIIALKELTPPLAIALFGEWGSGKSFFMQSLSNKIDSISKNQSLETQNEEYSKNDDGRNQPFCKGICQIHFNAWSYTDTNLWASLVSGIFEGLESYITKNKKKGVTKDKIEKELSQKLELAREQESKLTKIKEAKKGEIRALEFERDIKTHEENTAIENIKSLTLGSLIIKAKAQLETDPSYLELKKSVEQFGIENERVSSWSPDNVLKELTAWKTFGLAFFNVEPKQWFKFLGVLVLFLLAPFLIKLTQLDWDLAIFSTLGVSGTALIAVWEKAKQTLDKINPVITKAVNYKDQYEARMADLMSARDQEVEAEKLKILQGQMEITHINSQLDLINKEISQLEYSLKSSLSQKALYSFIVERSKSQDYERHLGIISTIRRDFETLSDLFLNNVIENKSHNNTQEEDKKQKSYEEFRDQFDRPLERIILYIDDLDRCPEDRVVEVLEAVNLLMAFPLFVVVVGVDPRWVENALIQKYQLQFTGQLRNQSSEINKNLKVIQASDYLEKIFQIPFHLKSASDDSVKDMITHLIGDTKANFGLNGDYDFLSQAIKGSPNGILNIPQSSSSGVRGVIEEGDEIDLSLTADHSSQITLEVLMIDQVELEYMKELSWIIGNTPRTVKRFVNTYRIIRAHEGLSYKNDDEKSELLALMFLLALRTGKYKDLYLKVKMMLSKYSNGMDLAVMIESALENISLEANVMDEFPDLYYQNFLRRLTQSDGLDIIRKMDVNVLNSHCEFIERFSFQTSKITSYPDFEDKELS